MDRIPLNHPSGRTYLATRAQAAVMASSGWEEPSAAPTKATKAKAAKATESSDGDAADEVG